MEKVTFSQLADQYGLSGFPEGLDPLFEQYMASYEPHGLLRRAFLHELCQRFEAGETAEKKLLEALDEIEGDPELLKLSNFLVSDLCAARHRLDMDDYHAMEPQKGVKHADLYSCLLLFACIEPSLKRLEKLGMPKEDYENVPFHPAKRQLAKLRDTGDGRVSDFPWDMNFYTGSLFQIGRFNFIPFRVDDPIKVFRKGKETVAFFTQTRRIRRDGQLDGVNGQKDPEAFEIHYEEKDGVATGWPICPAGVVERQPRSIALDEWELVLEKGDILMGFHIPGGPGYDPEHLRSDCTRCYEFFQKWFPEIDLKGFGSESWLYDPHLAMVLEGRGNITEMQCQMYIYPIESGERQTWAELFGGKKSLEEVEPKSRLQKAAAEYMQKGGHFTPCSMFVLVRDLPRVGHEEVYAPKAVYQAVWESMRQPLFEKEGEEGEYK